MLKFQKKAVAADANIREKYRELCLNLYIIDAVSGINEKMRKIMRVLRSIFMILNDNFNYTPNHLRHCRVHVSIAVVI